jgi:hypothetical protein
VKLEDYAATWITQRPGLRPRTVDLYLWLLKKHIAPYIGSVAVGKMSAATVREWRAKLLANGVSVSMAAKAYRLLRAIMTTAVDDDGLLPRNPCRLKGAGDEHGAERPVLTVGQVYELAERVGMRPGGNIRATPDGYRLRLARNGVMWTSQERYATRAEAERALWKMAGDGRADSTTTAGSARSCSWPRSPACDGARSPRSRRADFDLKARTVRIRAAYVEPSTGPLVLGPPKSQAGRRIVGIPAAIVPDLESHLAKCVKPDQGALVFPGIMGGPIRRGNFNKLAARGRGDRHAGAARPRPTPHR